VHLLGERLYNYEVRMEYLGLREVPARLANLILLLIESEGVRTSTHFKIPTRYTHQQLGTMIGANREAVTRAFNRLREVGGRGDQAPLHPCRGYRNPEESRRGLPRLERLTV
jgi:CRP/FNR family transcriptional regulator